MHQRRNEPQGSFSVIVSGSNNRAIGESAAVLGGGNNSADSRSSVVLGEIAKTNNNQFTVIP